MKEFKRSYPLFSLCGLNCGLCPMYIGRYCPGCGGGAGNQPCAIARCDRRQEELEYCYLCDKYPCEKYDGIDMYDSFITHRNQLKDFEKVKKIGMDAYRTELTEKMAILKRLLTDYNDGRRKNFFCIAVNLLALRDVKAVMAEIEVETKPDDRTLKEKAALAASAFQAMADERNIVLKLNKKASRK